MQFELGAAGVLLRKQRGGRVADVLHCAAVLEGHLRGLRVREYRRVHLQHCEPLADSTRGRLLQSTKVFVRQL